MALDFGSSSSLVLPSYSPPAPLPSYSCELSCGEQRLEHTPRSRASRRPPTSVFIKKSGKQTIVLNEQEEGASTPSYGRQSTITGSICLEHPENVLAVKVQLEGKLESAISEVGSRSIKLVNEQHTLWSRTSSSNDVCSPQVAFALILPATYKDKGKDGVEEEVPLPPSFHEHFISSPMLFVKAGYQLRFIITRIRHQKLTGLSKTKHILVPFKYVPRTRAHRPILPSPCFFSSVKTSPEEWYQAETYLKTRPNVKIDPVSCHMFLPAGRIYGLHDTIPIHVQLSGVSCALQQLFHEPLLDRVKSADSYNTVANFDRPSSSTVSRPLIRVYLSRSTSATINGSSFWRTKVLGEAKLSAMPPEMTSCCSASTSGCREDHVDWEGELRCSDEVTAGSFNATNVQVKDFIVLTISPPSRTSPLLECQISVPVRLVTDSFAEEPHLHAAAP